MRLIRGMEPRTATSTFTQLLNSEHSSKQFSFLMCTVKTRNKQNQRVYVLCQATLMYSVVHRTDGWIYFNLLLCPIDGIFSRTGDTFLKLLYGQCYH